MNGFSASNGNVIRYDDAAAAGNVGAEDLFYLNGGNWTQVPASSVVDNGGGNFTITANDIGTLFNGNVDLAIGTAGGAGSESITPTMFIGSRPATDTYATASSVTGTTDAGWNDYYRSVQVGAPQSPTTSTSAAMPAPPSRSTTAAATAPAT